MSIDTSAWGGIQLDTPLPPPEDFEGLTVDEAVDLITEWFLQNFERPEDSTPRDDGDWVYIWGGPYEHRDIIEDLLRGVVSDEIIEAAIDALDRQDTQWVPNSSRVQPPEEDDAPAISDYSEARIAHADMLRRIAALERTLAQGASVITDLPTADTFKARSINLLNLAWEVTLSIQTHHDKAMEEAAEHNSESEGHEFSGSVRSQNCRTRTL